jgi:tetratricopeptide (TPR) repeat protein
MKFYINILKQIFLIIVFVLSLSCKHQRGNSQSNTDSVITNSSINELTIQIEKDASNSELYYQRSVTYFNELKYEKSLQDIDQAIVYSKQNPLYYYFRGNILSAMNQTLKAAEAYEYAIKLKPDYREAELKIAELYFIVKEHQKSLYYLNIVIAKEPANANAHFFKGMNFKEGKDTMKAIQEFQSAYEYDKNFYDAAMQLGLIFSAKNNKIAEEYFSSAIRMQPRNEEAYFARAVYFQNNDKYTDALMDYRKVIAVNPSRFDAYYNVGYINFETKHFDEAIRNFDFCIQMNNNYPQAYYMRGLTEEINGNKAKAKLNYDFVLQLDPTFELAIEALKRIKK